VRPPPERLLLASYPFHCELQIRFSDIDLGRHVNNAVIAGYHEEARARMYMQLTGLPGPS
jgi:acyl-CoA thioesterase FadM